jgi:hypothetical protein
MQKRVNIKNSMDIIFKRSDGTVIENGQKYYDEFWKQYYTPEVTNHNVEVINYKKYASWRHIAMWTCDVFTEEKDYVLPYVIHALFDKYVEDGLITKKIIDHHDYYLSNIYYNENKDKIEQIVMLQERTKWNNLAKALNGQKIN